MYLEFLPPPSYRLVYVNDNVISNFNESTINLLGSTLLHYVEDSYRRPFEQHTERGVSCKLPIIVHLEIVPVDLPPFRVRAVHLPVFGENGQVVKIAGHGRYIESSPTSATHNCGG